MHFHINHDVVNVEEEKVNVEEEEQDEEDEEEEEEIFRKWIYAFSLRP